MAQKGNQTLLILAFMSTINFPRKELNMRPMCHYAHKSSDGQFKEESTHVGHLHQNGM